MSRDTGYRTHVVHGLPTIKREPYDQCIHIIGIMFACEVNRDKWIVRLDEAIGNSRLLKVIREDFTKMAAKAPTGTARKEYSVPLRKAITALIQEAS